jgi:hypothetical protein
MAGITIQAEADKLKGEVRGALGKGTISFRFGRRKLAFTIYAAGRKVEGIGTFPSKKHCLDFMKTCQITPETHKINQ